MNNSLGVHISCASFSASIHAMNIVSASIGITFDAFWRLKVRIIIVWCLAWCTNHISVCAMIRFDFRVMPLFLLPHEKKIVFVDQTVSQYIVALTVTLSFIHKPSAILFSYIFSVATIIIAHNPMENIYEPNGEYKSHAISTDTCRNCRLKMCFIKYNNLFECL